MVFLYSQCNIIVVIHVPRSSYMKKICQMDIFTFDIQWKNCQHKKMCSFIDMIRFTRRLVNQFVGKTRNGIFSRTKPTNIHLLIDKIEKKIYKHFLQKKEEIKMNKSILNYWNGLVCPALNRTKWCEFEIFGRSLITLISCCTNKKSDFPEKWLSAMAHCLVDEMCWNPLENWPIFVQIDKHLEIRYFGIDPIAVFSAEYIHETRSKMNRAITCMYAFD